MIREVVEVRVRGKEVHREEKLNQNKPETCSLNEEERERDREGEREFFFRVLGEKTEKLGVS